MARRPRETRRKRFDRLIATLDAEHEGLYRSTMLLHSLRADDRGQATDVLQNRQRRVFQRRMKLWYARCEAAEAEREARAARMRAALSA